jgi:hypothetical protein
MSEPALPATTAKRAILALDRSKPGKPDAKARAEEKAQEQLRQQMADELIQTQLPEVTGTKSAPVSERLINQAARAQVWPAPKNDDDDPVSRLVLCQCGCWRWRDRCDNCCLNRRQAASPEVRLPFFA